MSYPQPLSTLAPEFSNQLYQMPQHSPQKFYVAAVEASNVAGCPTPKYACPPKPCPPKCPPKACPPKPCPPKPCPPKCPPKACPPKPCPPKCPPKACPPKCPPKACPPKCPPKDLCADPCAVAGWGWLGALVLWFIIFTVLFWLIFYSLKPAFVLQADSNQPDTAKVLLAAVIAALIVVIIIWLIKAAVSRSYY